ncbi:MAG TPA: YegS/Rv2252/BmrU family lipid kinase [Cyclobacteriaceae bacterium]
MSDSNEVLFVINRYSGKNYREEVQEKILTFGQSKNIIPLCQFTREPGHATELAKQAVEKKYRMVFAVGGDGTVNEVAKGLLYTNIPLGIIPVGSGNGLARHLQIPLNVEQALHLINLEKTMVIDTFTVNGRFSTNVSGIGFDGHIAGLFGQNGKRGFFNYVKLIVSHFRKFKEFEYELIIDKVHSKNKAFIISCANASQFGNNAIIAPHASLCDQVLDICFVNKMSLIPALTFVIQLFKGTIHKSNHVTIKKANEVELRTQSPIPYHVDGEAAGSASHFVVKIDPASLLVAIPKKINSI